MNRIAVFSPSILFPQIKNAFEKHNFDVLDFSYGLMNQTNFIKKYIVSITPNYAYREQSLIFNNLIRRFIILASKVKIDIILFVKGQTITDKLIPYIRNLKIPIIYWSTDSLKRVPLSNCHLLSDFNFFQDGGDCTKDNDMWLPLGIDTENFFPTYQKKYDITFIGRMKNINYNKRYLYLLEILQSYLPSKYNINVISNLDIIKRINNYKKIRSINYYHKLPYSFFAKLIRESKIAINIHQDDGKKPINPLFFSIPYAYTLQLVDSRDYFNNWLTDDFFLQSEITELIEKIEYMLENFSNLLNRLISNAEILKKHTMTSRVGVIIDTVKNYIDG